MSNKGIGMTGNSGEDSNFESADPLAMRNEIQEEFRSHPVPWFRWVLDAVPLPDGARLLELGCGAGQLWAENRGRVPTGGQIILTDVSAGMLAGARGAVSAPFQLCAAGADAIPFPGESFHAVLAIGVLDLLPDLNGGLAEIRRVLKPGGMLAASAGGKEHMKEMKELVSPYLGEASLGGSEDRFGLENGEQKLAGVFGKVERRDYLERLAFTEAGPLIDYVLSESAVRRELTEEKISALIQQAKRRIGRNGAIVVTVQKGLFLALK